MKFFEVLIPSTGLSSFAGTEFFFLTSYRNACDSDGFKASFADFIRREDDLPALGPNSLINSFFFILPVPNKRVVPSHPKVVPLKPTQGDLHTHHYNTEFLTNCPLSRQLPISSAVLSFFAHTNVIKMGSLLFIMHVITTDARAYHRFG